MREALSATPIPDDVLASDAYAASRTFIQAVRDAGLPDAAGVPMPIDWEIVRRELAGELPPNISAGDVIYGVNGPGKHSLDTNYIPAAEATGHVDLKPLHQVDRLRRAGDGSWAVDVQRLDTDGTVVEELTMSADAVFLCAGSPNTTKLLVRAAAIGDIDDLPDEERGRYNTVAGLLMAVSGTLPVEGERIDCAGWSFEVVDLDGRRIDKVLATRMTPEQIADSSYDT